LRDKQVKKIAAAKVTKFGSTTNIFHITRFNEDLKHVVVKESKKVKFTKKKKAVGMKLCEIKVIASDAW
jgi:hypothetical protein